ncbi:MAG TPA: hypothetical protein ENK32_10575 [Anaerolineae bacterium]|nr:hypothetical protein [Anaerolineae bacterium]
MANETESASFLLSREELLLLLDLLEAESIPGLDPDPLGELNDDQRALALIWAGRALRARELAAVGENGELLVDEGLLTAVGGCIYWQTALYVYHWPEPGRAPIRFFGYARDGQAVTHTRPADVLHHLAVLPSAEALADEVTAVCQCQTLPDAPDTQFTLPRDLFIRARELAEEQEMAAAAQTLQEAGVPGETAQTLTAVLSGAPRMSIWQIVKRGENGDAETHDYTLLHSEDAAWLVSLPAGGDDLEVRTVTAVALRELLAGASG